MLGAGAVGGLVGAALASLGEQVTVIVRPEKVVEYPAELLVERPSGAIGGRAKVAKALANPVEVLWIATKTYQLETALQAVQALPRWVVPLLNGVDHVAVLRAHFGHDRVVPGTIAVEAERIAAGRFVQRSPFVNLNLASSAEPTLGTIVGRLREIGFTCRFIENEQTLLWSKLCFLGPFALVTSASGMNKGEIDADAEWNRKLLACIAETCAVAKASGAEVSLEKIEAVFAASASGMRSSMQKDLAAGRELELDAIGGAIVRGGEGYGIDVSTTTGLMTAIRAKAGE